MPLSNQVLAECETIDARIRFLRRELEAHDGFIAELETYKRRLDHILGDTDEKEQYHKLRSPVIVHFSVTFSMNLC